MKRVPAASHQSHRANLKKVKEIVMSVVEVESPGPREAVATELPLTYGQRALWFLERLAPGNAAYIIAGAARMLEGGPVEPAALRRAASALSARHAALRTTFHD